MHVITDEVRRARLAQRHRLLPRLRTDDVVRIAEDVVALHSTDPVTVMLSTMVRMEHPSIAAVEEVVYGDSGPDPAPRDAANALSGHAVDHSPDARRRHPQAVPPARRQLQKMLSAAGVPDPESWLEEARSQVLDHLHAHGPTTAREIGRQVPGVRVPLQLAAGKSYASTQGAHSQLITLLGFQGDLLRTRPSSWITGAYACNAATEDWLPGGLGELDEASAATELAAGGPPVRSGHDDRPAVVDGLDPRPDPPGPRWLRRGRRHVGRRPPGWLAADDSPWTSPSPGWRCCRARSARWAEAARLISPTPPSRLDVGRQRRSPLWVDGRIVGAWAQDKQGAVPAYFGRSAGRRHEINVRGRLQAMVGDTRFAVRFPGGVGRHLLFTPR